MTAPKKENQDEQALVKLLFFVKEERNKEKKKIEARQRYREARERARLDILKQNQVLRTQQGQLLQVITQ